MSNKLKQNLNNIGEDAARVVSEIGSLTKNIAALGSEKSEEVKQKLLADYEEQISNLRGRLDALSGDLRDHAEKADKHVRANPYAYIFAALGLGMLLGKLFSRRARD